MHPHTPLYSYILIISITVHESLTWVDNRRTIQDASKFSSSFCPSKMDGGSVAKLHHSAVDEVGTAGGEYGKPSVGHSNPALASSCYPQTVSAFFETTAAVGSIGAWDVMRVCNNLWWGGNGWPYSVSRPKVYIVWQYCTHILHCLLDNAIYVQYCHTLDNALSNEIEKCALNSTEMSAQCYTMPYIHMENEI